MGKFLIGLMACLVAHSASAEESSISAGSTSTMSQSDLTGGVFKDVFTDFLSTYHGPNVNKFGPYSQNSKGKIDPSALTGFDNETEVAYKLNAEGTSGIGPNLPFQYQPNVRDHQWMTGDVGIKWFNTATIKTENLQIATTAYVQAPTSDQARADHMNFALRTTPWIAYALPDSRLRLGMWTDIKYRQGVRRDDAGDDALAFKIWFAPYVKYVLNDKLAINVLYETEADRFVGDRPLHFTNVEGDLEPGILWQITPRTKVNPYLMIFSGGSTLSTENLGVGAVFYSRIL